MRVANFIVSIFSSIVMIGGDVVPIMLGLVLSVGDAIVTIFYGVDGTFVDPIGAFPILLISIAIVINSLVVLILSIVALIISRRPYTKTCTVLYIVNCVFTLFSVGAATYVSLWLNTVEDIPDNLIALYIWPVVGVAFLIAMIVLSVLSIVKNKEEENFREMIQDIRGKNGYFD